MCMHFLEMEIFWQRCVVERSSKPEASYILFGFWYTLSQAYIVQTLCGKV